MHPVDTLYIDDNGANSAGASPITGTYYDEVTDQMVTTQSPFNGRFGQLGTFPFQDDLRFEWNSITDQKISAGFCGRIYPPPTGGSQLPIAALTINQTSGTAPHTFSFDTSGSFDPDGGSLTAKHLYFDNNPNPVSLDLETGINEVIQTFSVKDFVGIQNPTPIQATLIVYDDEGQTATTSVNFTLNPY